MKVIEKPKLGHYPIALIPGQFTDHYRNYSSNQLKYMPLNTAVKTAPKHPQAFHMAAATSKINGLKRHQAALKAARASKRARSDGSSSESSSSDSSSDESSDEDPISSATESSSDESDVAVLQEKPQVQAPKSMPSDKVKLIVSTTVPGISLPEISLPTRKGSRKKIY